MIYHELLGHRHEMNQALTCRLVCKSWNIAVDKEWTCSYHFAFPLSPKDKKTLKEMENHPRNPFIGKNFAISTPFSYDNVAPDWPQQFAKETKQFLDRFGKYIDTLELIVHNEHILVSVLADVTLHVFHACKNLKSFFSLLDAEDVRGFLSNEEVRALVPADFHVPEGLKELTCLEHPSLQYVENVILEHGQNTFQLKTLAFHRWDSTFHSTLQWDTLVELDAESSCGPVGPYRWTVKTLRDFLTSLNNIQIPNLFKLRIPMCKGKGILRSLLKVTHNFPKLEALELRFDDRRGFHGFSNSEVAALPVGLAAAATIKSLSLTWMHPKCFHEFAFLLFFPSVENLKIETFDWRSEYECRHWNLIPTDPQEIVELSILIKDQECLYLSNVWERMPFLKTLSIQYNWDERFQDEDEEDEEEYGKVFTREEYQKIKQEQMEDVLVVGPGA